MKDLRMDRERDDKETNNIPEQDSFENGSETFSLRTQSKDDSRDRPVYAQGDNFPSDKIQAAKKELAILRELIIKQEKSNREHMSRYKKLSSALEKAVQDCKVHMNNMERELNDCGEEGHTFRLILEEYKLAVTHLLAEKDKAVIVCLERKIKLQKDCQIMKDHLINTKKAFEDLQSKSDSMMRWIQKETIEMIALNEKFTGNKEEMKMVTEKYELLKFHAQSDLQRANEELASMLRDHQNVLSRLNASMKRSELRIRYLEEELSQKTRENKALMCMCDDLINDQEKAETQDKIKKFEISETFPDRCC